MSEVSPAFVARWRKAVASGGGPTAPVTRHVLLTLSLYMDSAGGSCFPSTRELASATGLSERSVCTHLERAEAEGWVDRTLAGCGGRSWKRMEYQATLPGALNEVQSEGAETASAPAALGTERDSVPDLRGAEAGSAPETRGTERHDVKALKEVQSISSGNYPDTATTTGARADERVSLDELADQIIRAANRGMIDNPAIGDAANPIPIAHSSRQEVLDWLADGIPAEVIYETVYDRAKEYRPDGAYRRQVTSMAYFGGAVHEAHERRRAAETPLPNRAGKSRKSAGPPLPGDPAYYTVSEYQGLNS